MNRINKPIAILSVWKQSSDYSRVCTYRVMQREVAVIAKYPLAGCHCSPCDEAIAKNVTIPGVSSPISLVFATWLVGSETRPIHRKEDQTHKNRIRFQIFKDRKKVETNRFDFLVHLLRIACVVVVSLSHRNKRGEWIKPAEWRRKNGKNASRLSGSKTVLIMLSNTHTPHQLRAPHRDSAALYKQFRCAERESKNHSEWT